MDYANFLDTVTADIDLLHGRPTLLPTLAVDECANHPLVWEAQNQARQEGLIGRTVELWYQRRVRADGTQVNWIGRIHKQALHPSIEIGAPLKHASWSDDFIVQGVIAHFLTSDRIILVSENTKKDEYGLRQLLQREVAPALKLPKYHKLGILAFMKKGKTSWPAYTASLVSYLRATAIPPGYTYLTA